MSKMPSTFDEFLNGLAAHNGNLVNVVANDIPQLAALAAGDRMRLFARLTELGVPDGMVGELRDEFNRQRAKKTNATKPAKNFVEHSDLTSAEFAHSLFKDEIVYTPTHGWMRNIGHT
jgi:hypothetical protein